MEFVDLAWTCVLESQWQEPGILDLKKNARNGLLSLNSVLLKEEKYLYIES